MKRLLAVAAVVAMLGMTTNSADAGSRFRVSWGSGYGHGHRPIRSYYPSYNHYGHGYGHGRSVWHNTSHYDYHPGGYVRHGNHYDYVPGHYDYHRTGHWDHFGGHGHH